MPQPETFSYLVIGLQKFCQEQKKYPHPEIFHLACNRLALKMPFGTYPRTQTGLLKLFEQPVENWWPSSLDIPEYFDRSSGLFYHGNLSDEASEYFNELFEAGEIPDSVTIQIVVENQLFRDLYNKLKEEYKKGKSDRPQREYVQLRSFLIDHPYTTTKELREEFIGTRHISIEEVGNLYEDCEEGRTYWNCDRCGPLFEKHGRLQGIKPEACGDHRKELDYVGEVPLQEGLRRLKSGIHSRVCLPGIPEMNLWRSLEKLREKHPEQLISTRLWPGLDSYDMQLHFSDNSVWAVDVKDQRNPDRLGEEIKKSNGKIKELSYDNLSYTEGFYLFPSRRLKWRPNYIQRVRDRAKHLSGNTHLLEIPSFEDRVEQKIQSLIKEKKT